MFFDRARIYVSAGNGGDGVVAFGPPLAGGAALEEGEDHGRDDYRAELDNLDSDIRMFVETKLLPEQLRTHDTLSALKHSL